MKVEVDVLGSPSLIVLKVSVDIRQNGTLTACSIAKFCEVRGGRPGLPVPNSLYGLCERKATLDLTRNGHVPSLITIINIFRLISEFSSGYSGLITMTTILRLISEFSSRYLALITMIK